MRNAILSPSLGGQLQPGYVVNDTYEVVSLLGMGATGIVYLCKHRELNNYPVAMKVFFPSVPDRRFLARAFKQEVSAAYRVNHPNVIRCYEFLETDDLMAFTMEYAAGGSLAALMESEGALAIGDVSSILMAACAGLEAVHRAGFVHRDLKPENVLLTAEGNIKLSDFGIVTPDDPHSRHGKGVLGTVGYISPEYLYTGSYDARSDIYALGVIAYEMLTGTTPFRGKTPLHTLFMRAEEDPIPVSKLRPDCPPSLVEIVMRALSRDPARRPQSAEEMLWRLKLIDHSVRANNALTPSESSLRQNSSPRSLEGRGCAPSTRENLENVSRGNARERFRPVLRHLVKTVVLPESRLSGLLTLVIVNCGVTLSILAAWKWLTRII